MAIRNRLRAVGGISVGLVAAPEQPPAVPRNLRIAGAVAGPSPTLTGDEGVTNSDEPRLARCDFTGLLPQVVRFGGAASGGCDIQAVNESTAAAITAVIAFVRTLTESLHCSQGSERNLEIRRSANCPAPEENSQIEFACGISQVLSSLVSTTVRVSAALIVRRQDLVTSSGRCAAA